MKRFKNILYVAGQNPLQENDSTLDKLADLARLNEARVTVMVCDENHLFDDIALRLGGQLKGIKEKITLQLQQDLDTFQQQQRWTDLHLSVQLLQESGFIPIIKKVLRDKHDLVIKEAALDQGIDQLSMRLVRKCPCPVWIIKKKTEHFRRIMAAVDISPESEQEGDLNKKIIGLSHSLAQREQGEAFYLHSWRLEYEAMLRSPRFNVPPQDIVDMKKAIHDERLIRLQQLLQQSSISALDDHVLVREGHNKNVLNNLIEEFDIDVVVMGSVGRSGIPGLLIGNGAEKILSTIKCTVLTVKPDGFVSPVTL